MFCLSVSPTVSLSLSLSLSLSVFSLSPSVCLSLLLSLSLYVCLSLPQHDSWYEQYELVQSFQRKRLFQNKNKKHAVPNCSDLTHKSTHNPSQRTLKRGKSDLSHSLSQTHTAHTLSHTHTPCSTVELELNKHHCSCPGNKNDLFGSFHYHLPSLPLSLCV